MRYNMACLGAFLMVAACGSADQRGIEEMVVDRLGPLASVTSISDAVIYRRGDNRRSCVIVGYETQWGETMPPIMIDGWYNFLQGTWHTDNPREIDPTFNCADYATTRGEIIES